MAPLNRHQRKKLAALHKRDNKSLYEKATYIRSLMVETISKKELPEEDHFKLVQSLGKLDDAIKAADTVGLVTLLREVKDLLPAA